jgi:hypothetical protein
MRQNSSCRTALPAPSSSRRWPSQSSSTPLTAVPGPTTKPFHTLLATACGSRCCFFNEITDNGPLEVIYLVLLLYPSSTQRSR